MTHATDHLWLEYRQQVPDKAYRPTCTCEGCTHYRAGFTVWLGEALTNCRGQLAVERETVANLRAELGRMKEPTLFDRVREEN